MGKKPLDYLLLFILACSSIFIRGYSFGLGDQAIHLPLIYKIINPSLYKPDYLFLANQGNLSIFYQLIADIVKQTSNLYSFFLIGYFFLTIVLFIIIYKISLSFFQDNLTWFIAALFFILPYHVGGTAIMTMESSFVPRYAAFLLSLLIIYLILNKKYYLSWIILGLEFLLHPISAVAVGIILIAYIIFNLKDHKPVKLLTAIFFFTVIITPFLITNLNLIKWPQASVFNISSWLNIIKLRNSYAFPLLWFFKGWLSLLLGILPLVIYLIIKFLHKKNSYKDKILLIVLLTSFITLAFQVIFTSLYPVPQVINLQLGRIWIIPISLSFICLGNLISVITRKMKLTESTIKIVVLVILIGISFYKFPNIKLQNQNWIDIQLWVNNHTSKDCIVLVPFYSQGFRVYSKRAIVGEYKDGTMSFYSPVFAREWSLRLKDLANWEKTNLNNILKLQDKHHFSYLINNNKTFIPLEYIYKNSEYTVYQMPKIEEDCSLNKN